MVGTLLEATVKTFIEDRFKLDPVAATIMGNHSHDHRLGDLSADGFAARNEFTDDWLRRFTSMGEESLDPYQKVDRLLVLSELRGDKALQPFERWRRQPSLYPDLITRGAYYILLRGHSSPEDRLAMLAERLVEAPAALDAARANLDPARVPPEWIAIAERTAPAGAAFLREELPKSVPDTSLGRVVGRALLPAANAAADALDRYVAWLRADLLPRAKGTFAIGREAFEALLKEKELLDHDASSLRAFGAELFRETESKIAEAARAVGDDDWRDSIARLRRDHPDADQLVDTYRAEMERSREAVRLSSIASIPYGEDLVVETMPDFQRTTYPYAAYVAAAPFEANRRGRFWVTLPMADDDARRAPQKILESQQSRLRRIEEADLGHELFDVETPALDHEVAAQRLARERSVVRGVCELQVVPWIPLVARDDGDAGARMALEPFAAGALVVVGQRQRHPEPAAAVRLERRRGDVRGVRVRRALEVRHRLDDEIFAVRDGRDRREAHRFARALHLHAVRVDELVGVGVIAAQARDGFAPVVVTERACRLGDLRLGLAEELLAERTQARRVVVEQLLLLQQRLEGLATDRQRALRLG